MSHHLHYYGLSVLGSVMQGGSVHIWLSSIASARPARRCLTWCILAKVLREHGCLAAHQFDLVLANIAVSTEAIRDLRGPADEKSEATHDPSRSAAGIARRPDCTSHFCKGACLELGKCTGFTHGMVKEHSRTFNTVPSVRAFSLPFWAVPRTCKLRGQGAVLASSGADL